MSMCHSLLVLYDISICREERFKIENLMLIGIIPDMGKEPPLNTFPKPLTTD